MNFLPLLVVVTILLVLYGVVVERRSRRARALVLERLVARAGASVETADGRRIKIVHLTDEHLANWIYHVEKYQPYNYDDDFRELLRAEAERRGLSKKFLDAADGSFVRDGKRLRFDGVAGRYVEVGKA
jgi:hypothetical protein